ncbi:hypothetical protein P0Y35_04565 [Kiritimatiellaeota bacterium B1221]|nr:hypothetical protein [Kiritimatiellaeota bacterium B1221]
MKIHTPTLTRLLLAPAALFLLSTQADTFIPLVDMVSAGSDSWSWGGARIKESNKGLEVKESNRDGGYGDVFFSNRLPILPRGHFKVKANPKSGAYTLQLMGFQGEEAIANYDLLKGADTHEAHSLSLADLKISSHVDSILLKFWVVDAEKASTEIEILQYGVSIPGDDAPERGSWKTAEGWQTDNASVSPSELGIKVTVGEEKNHGAVVWTNAFTQTDGQWLLYLPEVTNTTLKLTLPAFQKDGSYLESVNTDLSLKTGWNVVDLSQLTWPEGAVSFQPKLWIENAAGSVTLGEWILIP